MGTILDYLKNYGDYTFEEMPFGEVDSLILSQFAYLKFDHFMSKEDPWMEISIQELPMHSNYQDLYADERYREDNTALFLGMLRSSRFGDLKMMNYVNQIDLDAESQFSAITLLLPGGIYYVAYRGTDETIVGWKEDLNLAFSEPIPGQLMSVEYLDRVAEKITDDFYIGGHSKGGNLAVYAATHTAKTVRDRIKVIYDHDGPGFRPEIKEESAYEEMKGRIDKTIPHSSFVGMLLSSDTGYRVVESRSIGVAQHNPYTWIVKQNRFKVVDEVYAGRLFLDETINAWILSLSQEQMHTFIDTLYQILLASGTDNLIDLSANWKKSAQKIGAAVKEVDEETSQVIIKILRALFEILSENAKERVRNRTELEKEKFEEGITQLEKLLKGGNKKTKK